MIKKDLIEKSPMRKLEKALNGGLTVGEVGVVTSKKGVGKTSILVQFGLDKLLQDLPVVHISFSQHVDYAITWYNDMFDELAKKKSLENAQEVKSQIIAKRIVLNFNQDTVRTSQIIKTIRALSEGGSKPSVIMIDDFNFAKALPEAVKEMKAFAKEMGVAVWYTAAADVQTCEIDESLKRYEEDLDIMLHLEHVGDYVKIKALKERGNKNVETDSKFDAKTMLLSEK
ncbi:hypothetical protein [Treponema pedis]|uniref:KaiC-like domain-containing protein n=1 Tax=Treponema pedis str. T A4 TaxID=1291379 RepID=S5ZN64_9SPIR|nr:hypothetical protein [Treponema pedis]AGT44032.1 hypothetical protein TPE_1537 [Treponema pedis str. T A4]